MVGFQDIPTVLVVEIFTHLDYMNLLRLEQTCERFRSIINYQHPLPVIMHRKKNFIREKVVKNGDESYILALHPCFEYLVGNFSVLSSRTMSIDDVGFVEPDTKDFTSLSSDKYQKLREEMAFGTFADSDTVFCVNKLPRDVPHFTAETLSTANSTVGRLAGDLAHGLSFRGDKGNDFRNKLNDHCNGASNGMCGLLTGLLSSNAKASSIYFPLYHGRLDRSLAIDSSGKPRINKPQHPLKNCSLRIPASKSSESNISGACTSVNSTRVSKLADGGVNSKSSLGQDAQIGNWPGVEEAQESSKITHF